MLVKRICLVLILGAFSLYAQSPKNCFIAKENGKVMKQEGDITQRYSPFSTFKVAIALMGFDSGVMECKNHPLLEFTDEIKNKIGAIKFPIQLFWKRAHTPETWMKYSVVWFSQEITKKIGERLFNEYVQKLNYGNLDVSGNPAMRDGLTHSWLSSSLKISAEEQVNFIEKLSNMSLPVSNAAQQKTIELLKLEDIWDGWTLHGKTGGGSTGWFVGWIEKDNRKIVFAQYVETTESGLTAGRVAKELAKDNLISLILVCNTF